MAQRGRLGSPPVNEPRRQPEQQAPPVQRLRIRYSKLDRARFASHRDFGRAFERALRRAGVPMAYSSGFSPHPRISYANAAPTGAATHAEYLEIGLAQRCDPAAVKAALNEAMPSGMRIEEVVEGGGSSLADRLTGSVWVLAIEADPDVVAEASAALLECESALVSRMTKAGLREFDVRAAIVSLRLDEGRLRLVSKHSTPLVRPDDVFGALQRCDPRLADVPTPLYTRLRQGFLADGEVGDPLRG